MKRLLILLPDGNIHKLSIGSFSTSFREAPLTATYLASLVPKELGFDITIIDESVQRVPEDSHFDIVAISAMTGTAPRAYHWSRHFSERGATTVIGGVHCTLCPDEVAQHCDTMVVGFAERTWPQLLRDFCDNRLERVYRDSEPQTLENLPQPRRDLQDNRRYLTPQTVFATRGCKGVCGFCSVSAAKFGWATRPVSDVIDEIKTLKAKRFTFNDVSIAEDKEYAKELLTEMIPLKKKWGGLISLKAASDPEIVELLGKSGNIFQLIGFESFSEAALSSISKGFNKFENYKTAIDGLHSVGVTVQGCFIFGFDSDDKDVFDTTIDYVNRLKIDIPRYAVLTPYPGTPVYEQLEKEGRILHKEWEYYDTQHVVYRPKMLTPKELDEGFKYAWNKTFSMKNIWNRAFNGVANRAVRLVGNAGYKKYIHKLKRDINRFPEGLSL